MSNVLYELLYIIDATLDEAENQRLADDVKKTILESGGEFTKESNWGARKLAYEIKKRTDGVYINLEFTAPAQFPNQLNELFRTRSGILRSLLIKVPKTKLQQEKMDAERLHKQAEAARSEREAALAAQGETVSPALALEEVEQEFDLDDDIDEVSDLDDVGAEEVK